MRTVSLKLSPTLDRRLTLLSRKRHLTRSEVLREALEAFGGRHSKSVSEVAQDLAGCLEGPRNLSTAREHMKGYGR